MTDSEGCSPADDKYVNKQGRCRLCKPCPRGKGRALSEAKTQRDLLDNNKCLPCKPCPEGTFNNLQGTTTECRSCTANKCSSRHRYVQVECSSHMDNICGSCLPGYYDSFKDTRFKCKKRSPTPSPTTPRPTHISTPVTVPVTSTRGNTAVMGNTAGIHRHQESHSSLNVWVAVSTPFITTLGVCSAIMAVIILIYYVRNKQKRRSVQIQGVTNQVTYSGSDISGSGCSSLIDIQESKRLLDIEPDGLSRIGEKLAVHRRSLVRGELQNGYSGPNAHVISETGFARKEHKCGCSSADCGKACKSSGFDGHIATKDDPLLDIISKQICHDPTDFFINGLKVGQPERYNIENDRERFPRDISQHDFVRNMIEKWVEKTGREATYGRIRIALCKGGFHRINTDCLGPVG